MGRSQINFVANRFTDETVEGGRVGILDNPVDDVTLARDGSDNRRLSAQARYMLFLVPMAVLVLTADISFVDFDDPHQFRKLNILHRRAERVAELPRGRVGRADLVLDRLCADAFLGVQNALKNLEPRAQG